MTMPDQSPASYFLNLPLEERKERLSRLTEKELAALKYDWSFWARPKQRLPTGEWVYWLNMCGRGYGKTRVGSETVREWARTSRYVNLIGPTADDARDIMVQGESGILAICPPDERPEYKPSKRKLVWPNGCQSLIFTADEPDRLRGKQHDKVWGDEIAAWRYSESWDQVKFGLRLGKHPQAVLTTTPRPIQLVREIIADPSTIVTKGTSHENQPNLSDVFLHTVLRKYKGTRLGRQEIGGELLDDNPYALFKRSDIDAGRVNEAPQLFRVVVAIDPAATSAEGSDETGIVVAGTDSKGDGYVLADKSMRASPEGWARAAILAYHNFEADRIIAESNNGGEMIASVIRSVDPSVPVRLVTASRGKAIRAEPVAALYEQHRVHHVGSLPALEDQMVDFDQTDPTAKSPDRMDAMVWALTELMCNNRSTGILDYLTAERERVAATRETDTHGATFRRD